MPLPICPNCHIGTQEVARDGVQIDICPSCRGVWLDRGELEKLLNGVRRAEAEWERDQATYPNPPQAQVDGCGQPDGGPYRKKPRVSDLFGVFD